MRQALKSAVALLQVLLIVIPMQALGDDRPNEQRRQLLEQKLRLVESLVNSPAARNSAYGREAETPGLLGKGRQLLEEAKTAIAADRFDRAEQALNEALRSITTASKRLTAESGGLADSALRDSLRDLGDQLASYRGPIADLTRDPKDGVAASELLAKVDAMVAESAKLEAFGRLSDANRRLAEAYKAAIEGLTRLRAGQTVVLGLKFDTPAAEYSYELRRFRSNEILIDMMLAERRADTEGARKVRELAGEGRKLRDIADAQAQGMNYKEAVASMEKAAEQLNRALQYLGVPVF